MLSVRGVNSSSRGSNWEPARRQLRWICHNQDLDMTKMMTVMLRCQSSKSDVEEAAMGYTSNINMPGRNRRKPQWHEDYVISHRALKMIYPLKMMGQRKGMHGYDVPSSPQDLFRTSLDIVSPLDMSMEGPPLTLGVNIHLLTPMKVDVYPVPQEGQQEQLEDR
ncbi:hypothetical protein E2C01_052174 [Portunus trituberculatus]|uniref:Uncharacterized protein n=1 Tax=Portunus trituberculatus TaxID=210409 RepID=A0A5B7GKW4_PORTR|nr:hypothetical protein [Portunus trituberculatus]